MTTEDIQRALIVGLVIGCASLLITQLNKQISKKVGKVDIKRRYA